MSEQAAPTPNPVRRADAEALLGLLAVLQGQLIGGLLDEGVVAKLVRRFVGAGLLEPEPDGSMPSPGRLGVALDHLNQRLRYALGEHYPELEPGPEGIVHQLRLPDDDAVSRAREELGDAVTSSWAERDQDGVHLFVVGGELPPDPDFWQRERALQDLARRLGGSYRGWGGPPPPPR